MGLTVEKRPILVEELATFQEVGACGTAVVLSPIGRIDDPGTGKSYTFGNDSAGPVSEKLYKKLKGIQWGDEPDTYGWMETV